MTASQFNSLDDQEKKVVLFEAKKVSEKFDEVYKCELFQIGDFFIESRTSRETKINRTLQTYTAESKPEGYAYNIEVA